MAQDNKTLGRFILDGIPPSPRGMPQVEVTFDIDANGILSVRAKDKATNREQSIRIEASTGLAKDEIERLKRDAELHRDEDKKKEEEAELRNTLETLIYTAEKTLREHDGKIKEDLKKEVEERISELRAVKDSKDLSIIRPKMDSLSASLQKIGQDLYASGSKETPTASGTNEAKDAEVEEKGKDEPEHK